ncbi:manganese efflux pump MntP family protein [Cellulomonas oligotrophica]|uniref:Putative manganese efflux pump MntP n=1 Tax=Cellulomonas oligotrophica TaxID=931536 RepID=A0A7Y9JWH6_9CELL|nr:manganese efflux pump MntP family protein [Cellulomonas oligotrophica]NYD84587.1 putative Mn2+ efflux pump MntP [Cellulomonas oligotrophica]GIG31653.1 hypothetical protein Col01nite_08120 [Cellulomonas oligotrophica]
MTLLDLLAIALGVSMDAVAVALAQGMRMRRPRVRDALLVAGLFGAFQGLMPLLGWALSARFAQAASAFAPWVAFGLLLAVGAHMVHEAREQATDVGGDDPQVGAPGRADGGPVDGPTGTPVRAAGGALALAAAPVAPVRPAVRTLLVLAVATSIDALAVGVGLGLMEAPVVAATGLMAGVTAVLSAGAVLAGARLGARLGRWATLAGGLVLVLIGARILLVHLLG